MTSPQLGLNFKGCVPPLQRDSTNLSEEFRTSLNSTFDHGRRAAELIRSLTLTLQHGDLTTQSDRLAQTNRKNRGHPGPDDPDPRLQSTCGPILLAATRRPRICKAMVIASCSVTEWVV